VGLTPDQAAAARAAAGPDGRVKVREAGTDVIREINVNPPTEETIAAPTPDPTGFDWDWAGGVAEKPEKAEAPKSDSERRSQIERRIEFLEESLDAERNKRKRGGILRGRETASEKRIKKSILDNKETLKNL
jgi:hypothetical protein